MQRICVYCGSKPGKRAEYKDAANELGQELIKQGIGLVYGGGQIGLMGQIADCVMAGGGEVTGIIPESLTGKEVPHRGLTELKVVDGMHERKALMENLSDGFIAMPGGLGTFEELLEALTWSQLRFHQKPCAVFNVCGYYDRLIAFIDYATEEGFIKPHHRDALITDDNAERLLQKMKEYTAPKLA